MNPTMESTTSPKTQEPSRPPPSHGSSLSSSPNQKPDVLYSPSVPGTGPRPSIRLDSKPKVPDENSSTKSVSGGQCRGKGIAEENVVDLTAETDSSSDSDSEDLNGKGKGKLVAGVLDSRRKRRRILDFNSPALDLEVEDGNDNGFLNLQSGFDSEQLALQEREDRESREWLTDGSRKGVDVENLERDPIGDAETRYRSEGEENLTGIDQLLAASALLDAEQLENAKKHAAMIARIKMSRRRYFKEQILNDSLRNASRFAQFQPEGKEYHSVSPVPERGMPSVEADEEIKDLSSPFSTAMRIVKGRMMKLNDSQENTSSGVSKSVPVIEWMPSNNQCHNHSKPSVPSLQALCLSTLAKNSDVIVSLEFVPDMLKHKLSQLVCDSQRMDCRFMDLLVSGCPTEIRVKNCSGITEEQLRRTLDGCSTQNLTVLQLDLSGRCMSDYIISANLAWSQNSLPALATISLRGACRLSDVGLNALVASAPALRYINLGQCSLLTSTGINNLADSLGSVLRELCIDDCQNIDAMLILPALKKLEHLEVLSVARVHNVCDDFVSELVVIRGPNMKRLVFSDCRELTNTSLKVIAETCSRLCALDLVNLYKLTDCAIQYLANGCQSIQTFKLCCNSFSDEAIAAFLETSGASLTEFSLNNVRKVGDNTAISLAKRSRKLLNLDLSFCRNLTNEALGLIVDSCLSLKVLKLFGCTQITDVFLDGHSNPLVQIIGLKMTPIVEHLNILEP